MHWALDAGQEVKKDTRLRLYGEGADERLLGRLITKAVQRGLPPFALLPGEVELQLVIFLHFFLSRMWPQQIVQSWTFWWIWEFAYFGGLWTLEIRFMDKSFPCCSIIGLGS